MKIKEIKVENFKNLENIHINLHHKLNIIVGNNGQGKTNFLESLHLLATTKSIKNKDDSLLIMHNKNYAKLNCILEINKIYSLKMILSSEGKSLFINNMIINKSSNFLGKLNTILFLPKEVELFDSAPKLRRKLIDLELGKISKTYLFNLNEYQKLLLNRNKLLKNKTNDQDLFNVIEDKMIINQEKIINYRNKFINSLSNYVNKYYKLLTNSNSEIKINYLCCVENFDEITNTLKYKYQKYYEYDKNFKATSIGIHREDIIFKLNDRLVNETASQGQKRLIVLALKLGLVEYIHKLTGNSPILLLDDVMSELDLNHQNRLLNIIPKDIQTIVTTTYINNLIKLDDYKLIKINNGKIEGK